MNIGVERCFSFINAQLSSAGRVTYLGQAAAPWFVTIARQSGCGAHVTGAKLAEILQAHCPAGPAPWTVFDRNLVEKVIEDHHLPKRLEKFMPEDRTTEIADIMDELFDLHPSSWTLVHKTSETILRLAELGNCILIGRAAAIVTGKLEHGLHVRLIGSPEKRVERMIQFEELDRTVARSLVAEQDRARQRYVWKYFHQDITDSLLYHLVINTDAFSCEQAAHLIAEGLINLTRCGKASATSTVSA